MLKPSSISGCSRTRTAERELADAGALHLGCGESILRDLRVMGAIDVTLFLLGSPDDSMPG